MGTKNLTLAKDIVCRGDAKSFFGLVISYVRENFGNNHEIFKETISARFLPFALSPDHPEYRAICLMCAANLEAWARAIREHAGLNTFS